MLKIKVKYHDPHMPELKITDKGDWIDLRIIDILNIPPINTRLDNDGGVVGWEVFSGDVIFIDLGVSMELPEGYEALIAPRSSLFKKHGLILTNSIGVIDNSYCGDDDVWKCILYCLHPPKGNSTFIRKYERLLQFRILANQPKFYLTKVNLLGNKNRNGFGSTGSL